MPAAQRRGHAVRALMLCGALAALFLAACSKDKNPDEPAKLTSLPHPSLKVKRMWSRSVDDKKAVDLRLGLGVSVADNRVYAAGHRGEVVALDLGDGKVKWRKKTGAPLAGGTAASEQMVVVGSSDGRLFAFRAADGFDLWNVRLNGEVLAPAAISSRLIAVRTVDGKLHGLSPADGRELWVQQQQVPRLSLRGTSSPVIVGDVVLCGFDNGKVVAVSVGDGSVHWETQVAPPHGRTELERLVDIDSQVAVTGHDVYVVGFQGRLAMVALDSGQIWWSHEASSYRGLTLDDNTLYVSNANGEILSLQARGGTENWRQSALLHRGLTGPATMDFALVVADFQGYLHFLDKESGALAARVSTSGKVRISTTPVIAGNEVVVANDRGQISAFWVEPIPGAVATTRKPVPAPTGTVPGATSN